jgi:hypothetical protein
VAAAGFEVVEGPLARRARACPTDRPPRSRQGRLGAHARRRGPRRAHRARRGARERRRPRRGLRLRRARARHGHPRGAAAPPLPRRGPPPRTPAWCDRATPCPR